MTALFVTWYFKLQFTIQKGVLSMAILTGNALKIIAAISMVIDHVGLMFFPEAVFLRILGRLAFPIFAFMIAEGCRYTRNRRRYFGMLFALAAVCQVVYYFFDGSLYFSVLMTFSLSILTIYALDKWKAAPGFGTAPGFLGALAGLYLLNRVFTIDYGFWGCVLPVFASLPCRTKYDSLQARVLALGLGLIPLALSIGGIQMFSLLALPLLLCYSGKRGKRKMKYFFYIFYPLHLVALQGLQMLIVR